MKDKLKYIDTHAHLDFNYDISIEAILEKALKANLEYIINISSTKDSLEKVINISDKHKNVYNTLGIHPHDAKDYNKDTENNIYSLKNNKTLAIGEIGLDYYYLHSNKEIQKKVFIKQIEVAYNLKLPLVLHIRDAHNDAIDILKTEKTENAVVHCYSSSKENLKKYLDLDYFISFTGIISFSKAKDIKEVFKYAPLDKIMLETDSPYLAPEPHRGKTNYPSYIPIIAESGAKIKELDINFFANKIYENSIKFFKIKEEKIST